MSTLATTNIKHPSSASNNIVLDSAGGVDLDALTVSGSAPADSVNIDASGRLLVGTSTGASGGNAQYSLLQVVGNSAGGANFGVFNVSRNENSADITLNEPIGLILFGDKQGGEYAEIRASADGAAGSNDYPGRLTFSTTADGASSPTERLRISSVGNVGISDVSSVNPNYGLLEITRPQDQPDNKFHLAFHRYANKICGMGFLDNSQTFAIQNADNNTGNGVTLAANGTSWGTTSDERKKRIGASIENGLDKIADWRCVYFSYLNESEDVQRVGLIAQDVQQTLPEAVSVEEDEIGTLQLKYAELIPVLVKALQEAKQRIETLEAAVAALDAA